MALCYDGTNVLLHEYIDSDFEGGVDSRRSTTGYVFTLGSGAVRWVSRPQKIVALSMTETEYVTMTEACKKFIWLKDFMKERGQEQVTPTLHSDSQSAIGLVNNPAYHDRIKRIYVWYPFIHIFLNDSVLSLLKIHMNQNIADMLIKVVTTEKLNTCSASVSLLW